MNLDLSVLRYKGRGLSLVGCSIIKLYLIYTEVVVGIPALSNRL